MFGLSQENLSLVLAGAVFVLSVITLIIIIIAKGKKKNDFGNTDMSTSTNPSPAPISSPTIPTAIDPLTGASAGMMGSQLNQNNFQSTTPMNTLDPMQPAAGATPAASVDPLGGMGMDLAMGAANASAAVPASPNPTMEVNAPASTTPAADFQPIDFGLNMNAAAPTQAVAPVVTIDPLSMNVSAASPIPQAMAPQAAVTMPAEPVVVNTPAPQNMAADLLNLNSTPVATTQIGGSDPVQQPVFETVVPAAAPQPVSAINPLMPDNGMPAAANPAMVGQPETIAPAAPAQQNTVPGLPPIS